MAFWQRSQIRLKSPFSPEAFVNLTRKRPADRPFSQFKIRGGQIDEAPSGEWTPNPIIAIKSNG